MKITLTVTGGFTGIGGKWEIDAASGGAQSGNDAVKMRSLTQLIAAARSAGVFGNDYSEVPRRGAARDPVERADTIPADFQTYELEVNGERVRWREPAAASTATAPPIVRQLKQRIMQNTPRQPYQPL
jgi:hypothetical protein